MAELIRNKIARKNRVNVQSDSEPTVTRPIQIKVNNIQRCSNIDKTFSDGNLI